MSPRHGPYRMSGSKGGEVTPSGSGPTDMVGRTNRLQANGLVSGVVTAVYVPKGGNAFPSDVIARPTAVFCDVAVYSSRPGMSVYMLRRVQVANTLNMQDGHIWKPRAATMDVRERTLEQDFVDPADMDGDHVLVDFIENNITRPVIVGRIPHPRAGEGNDDLTTGHRQLLEVVDGDPEFWKKNGTFFGVDKDGNFKVNTTRAHSGVYTPSGKEEPALDAANGSVLLDVSNKAKLLLQGTNPTGGDVKFKVEVVDGKITLQLDGADKSLVLEPDTLTWKLGDPTKTVTHDGSTFTIKNGGAVGALKVEGDGANAVLTVGTGAVYGMVWDMFDVWATAVLSAMKSALAGHIHNATAPGAPTSPSTNWTAVFGAVDTADSAARSAIKAEKLKLPYP